MDTAAAQREQMMRQAYTHFNAGQLRQAEILCRHILTPKADHPDALHMLGIIALNVRQFEFAERCFRESLRYDPQSFHAMSNLGVTCRQTGRMQEAIECFRQAIALNPRSPELMLNLGGAYRDFNMPEHAESAYIQALKHKPDFAEAHIALSTVLLRRGDFARGWAEGEWRLRYNPAAQFQAPQPQWKGEPLEGKTLYVYGEQGFGDTLQYIRYIPRVLERGGKVIVAIQGPLVRLLQQSIPGVTQWLSLQDPRPDFDFHCSLMSLPFLFGTTLETIPATPGYLQPAPDAAARWREKLAADPAKLKVGLVWQGNRAYITDTQRSIPANLFNSLKEIPGISFYSLQKDRLPTDPLPDLNLIDHTAELADFADTAAFIANLDLVIAADTAVAHLTGALNKPIWILLPFVPDWRWLANRQDSPWYPSARLFTQGQFNDWPSVVERVKSALLERAK